VVSAKWARAGSRCAFGVGWPCLTKLVDQGVTDVVAAVNHTPAAATAACFAQSAQAASTPSRVASYLYTLS
jgi:hypothetical protein